MARGTYTRAVRLDDLANRKQGASACGPTCQAAPCAIGKAQPTATPAGPAVCSALQRAPRTVEIDGSTNRPPALRPNSTSSRWERRSHSAGGAQRARCQARSDYRLRRPCGRTSASLPLAATNGKHTVRLAGMKWRAVERLTYITDGPALSFDKATQSSPCRQNKYLTSFGNDLSNAY